jgi:hypothetical protein
MHNSRFFLVDQPVQGTVRNFHQKIQTVVHFQPQVVFEWMRDILVHISGSIDLLILCIIGRHRIDCQTRIEFEWMFGPSCKLASIASLQEVALVPTKVVTACFDRNRDPVQR